MHCEGAGGGYDAPVKFRQGLKEVKMAEEVEKNKEVEETKEPKKSPLKWVVLIIMVLVLGAGGYFGWNMFKKENKEDTETSESTDQNKEEEAGITLPLDSFIVNLADKTGLGKRYLKVKITLQLGKEEHGEIIGKNTPQLRDTILLLLSSQSSRDIRTMEGKLELKHAILSRVNQILGEGIVSRIYFTEFVVQ